MHVVPSMSHSLPLPLVLPFPLSLSFSLSLIKTQASKQTHKHKHKHKPSSSPSLRMHVLGLGNLCGCTFCRLKPKPSNLKPKPSLRMHVLSISDYPAWFRIPLLRRYLAPCGAPCGPRNEALDSCASTDGTRTSENRRRRRRK